jgi:plastocyanin
MVTAMLVMFDVLSSELIVKVIDIRDQDVNDIVLYVRPIDGIKHLPLNTNALFINQKDKKFSPYITVLQKGQAIKFVNQDDITHHIYSVSGENRFEFKIKSSVEQMTAPMLVAEEIAMGCNIHDWMSGYTLVVDTPYYGKTNGSGQLSFTLPYAGEYLITAWHPQLDVENNRISQLVTIDNSIHNMKISLPKKLLPIPEQKGQDEFNFIEEY